MLHSIGVDFPEENTFISFDNSIAYTTANVKCFSENLLFLKTKITPVKLLGFQSHADLQNEFADEDTSIGCY